MPGESLIVIKGSEIEDGIASTFRDIYGLDANLQILTEDDVTGNDTNSDGAANFLDIAPFIAILSTEDFKAEADIDMSGEVNFLDIVPFIAILSGT